MSKMMTCQVRVIDCDENAISDANGHTFQAVLNQLLLEKPQENEISRPKTNNSRITHTSSDKSRVTCIQVFTNHVSFY